MRVIATTLMMLLTLSISQAQNNSTSHLKQPQKPQYRVRRPVRHSPPDRTADIPAGISHQLPIRRVILYSNGVAYFERRGVVSGHAEINLSFKQSQVDDVLKSMIVLDLGRGQIGAVSYNSSAPPSARLAEIPFSVEAGTAPQEEAAGGLAGVLRQLQGARVVVTTTANRSVAGAILTVEERRAQISADKPPVITHALVIGSGNGELASFELSDVRSVRLVDEGARRDITQFADASAAARRRDAKTIVITSDGAGERELVVSYTVAAPIWKTTYRVVLDATGKPFVQGWAIIDNVSEEDWTGVALSLVSGAPVSFIQPIQQPLYRYRPVIPIPEDLNLDPQVHEPGVGGGIGPGRGGNTGGGDRNEGGGGPGGGGVNYSKNFRASEVRFATTLSDAVTSEESGVKTAARGNEVGDLFEYRVQQPVTLLRNRSALIPILQTRMEGERVSIYNEAARKDRPMSGIRLRNSSALTLEGGSLTVIDGDAYAGEALIERLKPNEDRFVSFALDLSTLVTARARIERAPVFLVRALNGVFQAHYYETEQKTYTVTNQSDRPRIMYLEHPARNGWQLSDDTPRPVEKTPNFYRFRLELAPHTTIDLTIGERRALMDSYTISNLKPADLELFIARGYVDESLRVAFAALLEMKSRLAATDARLAAIAQEAAEIEQDQQRLRENIKALGSTAEARQLIARYIAKAGEQESRIESLRLERRKISDERVRLQDEINAAIRALPFERKR